MFEKQTMIHGMSFTLKENFQDEALDNLCLNLFGLNLHEFNFPNSGNTYYSQNLSARDGMFSISRQGHGNASGTTLFQVHGLAFETMAEIDFLKICNYILENDGNVTQLDIAKDDTDGLLPFDEIIKLSDVSEYKDRICSSLCSDYTKRGITISKPPVYMKSQSRSIIYGGKNNRITIYDKQGLECTDFPWTRVEIRIRRRDLTISIINDLVNGVNLDKVFNGLMRNYLTFKEEGSIRKYDRKILEWWTKFLNDEPRKKFDRKKYKVDNDIKRKRGNLIKYLENNGIYNLDTADFIYQSLGNVKVDR